MHRAAIATLELTCLRAYHASAYMPRAARRMANETREELRMTSLKDWIVWSIAGLLFSGLSLSTMKYMYPEMNETILVVSFPLASTFYVVWMHFYLKSVRKNSK